MENRAAPLVMIVEDDQVIARLIATMLGAFGYRTQMASSAEEAARALPAAQPALVTLDLNLPGMGGADFLQQLRAAPDTAALPVIVITAQQQIPAAARALADAVLIKPFGLEELVGAVGAATAEAPLMERALGAR